MHRSRVFLLLLIGFLAGVVVRSFVVIPLIAVWLGAVAAAVFLALGIRRAHRFLFVSGLLLLFLAGILRFDQDVQSAPKLPAGRLGIPVAFEGTVFSEPDERPNAQRITVRMETLESEPLPRPVSVLLTTRVYPRYRAGDRLRVEGVLREPENTPDFDYRSYLAKEGIRYVAAFPRIEPNGRERGVQTILADFKLALEDRIDRVLTEPHAALLKGLLLGERASLPADFVEALNRTGTSHIVALSGYNITLVGGYLLAFLLWLTVPFQVAFWIAVLGILFFVILTGASPSLVRAAIMGILVLVAKREGRRYQATNALVCAAALMVFQSPLILRFDAAFQLSFLATVGLIFLSPYVDRWIERLGHRFGVRRAVALAAHKEGKRSRARQTLIETLSAQCMVLPLLIYLFGRISLVSPLTNILVLTAVPYTMGIGFLSVLLGFLWQPLSQVAGWLSWGFLEYQIRVVRIFSRVPLASVTAGTWAVILLLFAYPFLFWRLWKRSGATSRS